MIHKRHITSLAVAVATVLLMAGPAFAVGKFQPLGQYHVLTAASHGPSAGVVTISTVQAPGDSPGPRGDYGGGVTISTVQAPGDSPGPRGDYGGYVTATSGPNVVHATSPSDSFDWGDAAIGAGAAILVVLLIGGGIRATSHRPRPTLAKTG
jgi:hypothetical protein